MLRILQEMKKKRQYVGLLLCWGLLTYPGILAGSSYNYPDLKWHTTQNQYFIFHFHEGTEFSANRVIRHSEAIFFQIAQLFNFKIKQKIHVIIRDEREVANAFAVFQSSLITLWTTKVDLLSRAPSNDILYVFAHELGHIVSLKTASYFSESIPEINFEWNNKVKLGHPDLLSDVTFPWSNNGFDMWWSEGIAEYITETIGMSHWNSSRDMFLRTAILENSYLSMTDLPVIHNKRHLNGELVYNQGHDILRYIGQIYHPQTVFSLAQNNQESLHLPWRKNIDDLLAITADELFESWLINRKEKYLAWQRQYSPFFAGTPIFTYKPHIPFAAKTNAQKTALGIYNNYFQISPDGQYIAFLTDGSPHKIKIMTAPKPLVFPIKIEEKPLPPPQSIEQVAKSGFCFTPDSKTIVFSKHEKMLLNIEGAFPKDLWQYDLIHKTERKITRQLRAGDPSCHPNGKSVIFTSCYDANCSLIRLTLTSGKLDYLIDSQKKKTGLWIEMPNHAPDGQSVIFGTIQNYQHNIVQMHLKTRELIPLTNDYFTNRDPVFFDTHKILFSSNRNFDAFNIYELNLLTKEINQLTHVKTGAFSPRPFTPTLFSYRLFSSSGFQFHLQPYHHPNLQNHLAVYQMENRIGSQQNGTGTQSTSTPVGPPKQISQTSIMTPHPYRWLESFKPVLFVPKVGLKGNKLSSGLTLLAEDYLEKLQLVSSLELAEDYFLSFSATLRTFYPTLRLTAIHGQSSYLMGFYSVAGGDSPTKTRLAGVFKYFSQYNFLIGRIILKLGWGLDAIISNSLQHYLSLLDYNQKPKTAYQSNKFDVSIVFKNVSSGINPRGGREIIGTVSWIYNRLPPQESVFKFLGAYTEFINAPWAKEHTIDFNFTFGIINRPTNYYNQFTLQASTHIVNTGYSSITYQSAGYSQATTSGETLLLSSLGYRFPIVDPINQTFWVFYLSKLYATLFASGGNTWGYHNSQREKIFSTAFDNGSRILSDSGLELRLESFLHNVYRWNSILRIAYAFQDIAGDSDRNSDGLRTMDNHWQETVARGFRYYLSIGSNF